MAMFERVVFRGAKRYRASSAVLIFVFPIILSMLCFGCGGDRDKLDVSMYQYRDTKNLVRFVHEASRRLEREGSSAIDTHFKPNRSGYRTDDFYLYIYDMEGVNLFHAGMEELEGHDLKDVTDKNGKKITQMALAALADKANNPHSWVHYSWWEPGNFYPVPKSSCHFKVETRDGKSLFVGGGASYPHEEREFIRILVDSAAKLIAEKGRSALDEISDPLSTYNFRDVRVFAFSRDGETLLSPTIGSDSYQMNLLEFADEAGHKPFVVAVAKLDKIESDWEIFVTKKRYQRELSKKSLYVRKTRLEGKDAYVAAVTDMPEPPY